jgi:hypothetical protein
MSDETTALQPGTSSGLPTDAVGELAPDAGGEQPWYVYDSHAILLAVVATRAEAERWAFQHWGIVEIADREQIDPRDFWYLLLAAPQDSGYRARDFQARIMRHDRVWEVGRDQEALPKYPV